MQRHTSPRYPTRSAVAALAALTVSTFGSAQAAEPTNVDTSDWACNECPFEDSGKVDSQLELGAISVSDDAARFGRYSGLDQQGVRPVVNASARQTLESGARWSAEARDLGLGASAVELRGGKPGLDLKLGYEQLPNNLFDTARSPYEVSPFGFDSLPSGWVRGLNTRQMPSLASSLQPIDIESGRRTVSARLRAALGADWSTYAGYRQQKRDGTWRQSASFGFSAIELPKPLEDVTESVALGLRYAGERLTAQFGYDGSFYSNRNIALAWDNPYLGPAQGQLAQAPDNSAHQFSGTMNYRFGERTSLAAVAAFGQLRQDDAFLPYTINALPMVGALPRSSLDGEVQTTHLSLALMTGLDGIAPFLRTARVKVDYRYDKRDNNTPQNAYAYIVTDQFTSTPATNQPYGFENQRVTVSGDYDLRQLLRFWPASQTLRISGGWRHDEVKRSLQEATDSTEDTGWGRLTWRPADWIDLGVKWGGANRDIDRYQPVAAIMAPQNPLLRKYNMADRERQFAEGSIGVRAGEKLSFIVTGRYANDDYVSSPLGLRNSRESGGTFGANWTATDKLTIFADAAYAKVRALQAGSAAFLVADWTADSNDLFRSASAGFRITGIAKGIDLDVRGFVANSNGDTVLTTPTVSSLPQLRTRMNGAEIGASWQRSAPLSLRAALRYEHFDADDYALDGVLPSTVPTLLSLGAAAYDYDLVTVMLSWRYMFGATEAAAEGESKDKAEKE